MKINEVIAGKNELPTMSKPQGQYIAAWAGEQPLAAIL
jgi:hypothetical protein